MQDYVFQYCKELEDATKQLQEVMNRIVSLEGLSEENKEKIRVKAREVKSRIKYCFVMLDIDLETARNEAVVIANDMKEMLLRVEQEVTKGK